MATRIHVSLNGEPMKGADVYVGELLGTKLTTNANGRVSFELTPADWKGCVTILIEGVPTMQRVIAQVLLKEGKDHEIDIIQPL
jgi:hypothetical protein